MSNEHQKAAQQIFNNQGKVKGSREIQRNLADVVRGGDPDIISYWKSVLEAFENISRKSR